MKHSIILGWVLFLVSFSSLSNAYSPAQQNNFLDAYNVLKKGGMYDSSHLQGYILKPYLDYERIKQNLKRSSDQTLIVFIRNNPRSLLAETLSVDLMGRFAKQRKWHSVLNYYHENQGGTKAKCYGLEARIHTSSGNSLQQSINKALKLWLSGNSRPNNCNALFTLLRQKGQINDSNSWKRIGMAMDKGNTRLAKSLIKYTKAKSLAKLWAKMRHKPARHLSNRLLQKKDSRTKEVIAYGIKRLSRKNTQKARVQWNRFQRSHPFTPAEKAVVESYIGTKEAYEHNPYALKNLSAIPAKMRSEDASVWMARMAIRQGDWKNVLQAIYGLPAELHKKDIWQYWQAYAEKRTRKRVSINLHKLAENASFYGFLAADQLKLPYKRLTQKEPNWNQFIPKIKNQAAIKRASELFTIGLPDLAKKEWYWALKQFNKNEKLAAAAYAHQINQPFMGIVTVSQTKDWNQTGLRFPLRYQTLVKRSAQAQRILPAWVYGIMRRESAFDPVIVSSANAKGLMQVLPSTAKLVAKKLGIRSHRTSDLLIPEKNARIGAGYLSQMLKKFNGNYVKATASYNAGPHRIPRWAPDYPISAAQWIESIPFNETRNYVRAVMSYTTIYDHKLNYKNRRNLRLSQRLQKVGP